jgi:CRISPR-associated exonuclease Cas4
MQTLKKKMNDIVKFIDGKLRRFVIKLTYENEEKILEILGDIKRILSSSTPPKPKFERKCRKCAYYEFCFL